MNQFKNCLQPQFRPILGTHKSTDSPQRPSQGAPRRLPPGARQFPAASRQGREPTGTRAVPVLPGPPLGLPPPPRHAAMNMAAAAGGGDHPRGIPAFSSVDEREAVSLFNVVVFFCFYCCF